jgi:hypothetical protein
MNLVMDRKELEAKARLQYYQIVKAKRAILKKRKDQGRQVLAADFEEKAAQSTLWQMCVRCVCVQCELVQCLLHQWACL